MQELLVHQYEYVELDEFHHFTIVWISMLYLCIYTYIMNWQKPIFLHCGYWGVMVTISYGGRSGAARQAKDQPSVQAFYEAWWFLI